MSKKIMLITHGPSRETMFDGLRLTDEKRAVPFQFTVDGVKKETDVLMRSIREESQTSWSWQVEFFIGKGFIRDSFLTRSQAGHGYFKIDDPVLVKGYYSTKTRTGFFTVNEDELAKRKEMVTLSYEQKKFLNAYTLKDLKDASPQLVDALKSAEIKWFKDIIHSPLQLTYFSLVNSSEIMRELQELFKSNGFKLPEVIF